MAIKKKYAIYEAGVAQYYFITKLSEEDFSKNSGMKAGYYGINISSKLLTKCCKTVKDAKEELFKAIPKELKEERSRLRAGIDNLEGRVEKINNRLEKLLKAKSLDDFEIKEEEPQ